MKGSSLELNVICSILRWFGGCWSFGPKPVARRRYVCLAVLVCFSVMTARLHRTLEQILVKKSVSASLEHLCAVMYLGDVPRGNRGDPGCHWAHPVQEDPRAPVQADLQMCGQPPLPGTVLTSLTFNLLLAPSGANGINKSASPANPDLGHFLEFVSGGSSYSTLRLFLLLLHLLLHVLFSRSFSFQHCSKWVFNLAVELWKCLPYT